MVPGLVSCCALELRTVRGTELRGEVTGVHHLLAEGMRELPVRRLLRERRRRQNCFYQGQDFMLDNTIEEERLSKTYMVIS